MYGAISTIKYKLIIWLGPKLIKISRRITFSFNTFLMEYGVLYALVGICLYQIIVNFSVFMSQLLQFTNIILSQ